MARILDRVSLLLIIAGALNWGLLGLFSFNLVEFLFGGLSSLLTRTVYIVIAASGIWCITLLFKDYTAEDKN